jgi:hypothetical protein
MTMKRTCGDCTLCCKLVPVAELGKPANTRCQHQTRKGCSIYPRRPGSCQMWSCRWLVDPSTSDLSRPDRTHYVIDLVPDSVVVSMPENTFRQPLIQIWIDPRYPDAHRDPNLRRYLIDLNLKTDEFAMVRYGNKRSIMLVPPHRSDTGKWLEIEANMTNIPGGRL